MGIRVGDIDRVYTVKVADRMAPMGKDGEFQYATLHHRLPTPDERAGYINSQLKRPGKKKAKVTLGEARQDYGMKVLTGFDDGDFEVKINGEWVAISSNSNAPNYYKDWLSFMKDEKIHLVELLGGFVFGEAGEIAEEDDGDDERTIDRKEKSEPDQD